jgi:type VI secretion system protein ImpA
MASPALVDFEALVAPVPGDLPGGSPRVFMQIRAGLEELRREERPEDYGENDPRRPAVLKRADWSGIMELARQTLQETSKDIRLAGYFAEALVREHGFAGLRDGVRLLRELVDRCWDFLNPPPDEDGDQSGRYEPLTSMLDEPVGGLRLPTTIRQIPLLSSSEGKFGYLQWKDAQEGDAALKEAVDKALQTTPPEESDQRMADIQEAQEELGKLVEALENRVGSSAPRLLQIREAVSDCTGLVRLVLEKTQSLRPASTSEADTTVDTTTGQMRQAGESSSVVTRADVLRRLREAADVLQRLEPHSPIPYLVRRAVELGELSFPQLIRALIRDPNVLGELSRELGIKESDNGT